MEQNHGQADVKIVTSSGSLIILDPLSGKVLSEKVLSFEGDLKSGDLDFVLMRGVSKENGQVKGALVSIPKSGEGKITLLDESVEVKSESNLPQFFT